MSPEEEKILIVDDDESIRFLLTKALERDGYWVENASDGLEGLKKLQGSPFSLLLTDLMMPNMGGMDLLRHAREMDSYLEIIVITAAGSIESAITALRDGQAYDYLMKPLDSLKQLSVVVERALAHRRLMVERTALQQQRETEARRLQTLVANVNDVILAASAEGVITVANPAANRLLDRKTLVGEPVQEALPPKLANIVENWQAIAGCYPASLEIRWNEESVHLVSLTPFLDQGESLQGWVMVVRDITPIKRLDTLKTQAISETVAKIRKPLAEAMSALVDLNRRAPQDERVAGSLFQLTKTWERIQSWSDELLSVVQSDAEWNIQPVRVDPGQLLLAFQNDPQVGRYQQGGGRLSLLLEGPLPPVRTDTEMLSRLLRDLFQRAVMRSPQGGEIRIYAQECKQQVWVEISDDGPPANDTAPVSFSDHPFADWSAASAGLGMDLTRARSILDRLDGQLWVGGKGPRGSTIIICLPVIGQKPAREEEQV